MDKQVEGIVHAAMQILYDDRTHQQVVEMLKQGERGLIEVFRLIMRQLGEQGVAPEILQQAADTILALIAELAEKAAGVQISQKVLHAAMMEIKAPQQQQPQQQQPQQPPQKAGGGILGV